MKVQKHQSFLTYNSKDLDYGNIVSKTQSFIKKYNKLLKAKVHKKFHSEFYFSRDTCFNIKVIFSQSDNLLVYFEANGKKSDEYVVYYTEKDPQIYIQELLNDFNVTITKHESQFSAFSFQDGNSAFITDLNYVNCPVPYEMRNNNFISIFNYSIKLEQKNDSILTSCPGMTFLMSSSNINSYESMMDSIVENFVQYEIRKNYLGSELFRKALIHPQLKNIALRILDRKARADSKVEEYPFWEFEEDLNRMREVAKSNSISNNYVDEMLKDPQYYPLSGSLLFYYSSPFSFMIQWLLINSILLFVFIVIVLFLPSDALALVHISLGLIVISVNGWVFKSKPDSVEVLYWILPFGLFIIALSSIYFKSIISLLKN